MKTLKSLLTLALVAGFTTVGFGQISTSAHDFSGDNWNNSGEICIVCHTPHNAVVSVAEAPLWNHEVTKSTFGLYTSTTIDATMGEPSASSKLCLSCHDGTVAVDNYGGRTNGGDFVTGKKNLGIDMHDDHPISFVYDNTLAGLDGGLFDPSSTNSGLGGTINTDLLYGGQLECASCHDVHNASGESDLLVMSNAASALCLTCHNK